jgi:hypothetical protein
MKCFVAFALVTLAVLASCGKDSNPPAPSTSAQVANSANPTATPQPNPGSPVGFPPGRPSNPAAPSTPDGAYCPVVELAGAYTVSGVTCFTDGRADKVDGALVPTQYVIKSEGDSSGTITLKVGVKIVTLGFPRKPDTWLDFLKNGTQCSDGATKSLTQRCPGVKDSTCYYSLNARAGKFQGLFYRVTGTHEYECHLELAAAQSVLK